ncbi:hypothetical protein FORC77_2406 [Vibrio vulnificus]|nr:hypothetical protein FORC77_2406 [Vibrio vulnificus]
MKSLATLAFNAVQTSNRPCNENGDRGTFQHQIHALSLACLPLRVKLLKSQQAQSIENQLA